MTRLKKITTVALSAFALQVILSSTAAHAQESLMTMLDVDDDGLISLKEASVHPTLLESFSDIDLNEDGYISLDELLESDVTGE